jgi:hypothetical protein
MSEASPSRLDYRQHVEAELLEAVRRTQLAWRDATEEKRDVARQRFKDALNAFNSVVLHGKEPDGG